MVVVPMSNSELIGVSQADESDLPWLAESSKRAYDNEGFSEHESHPEGYDTVKGHSKLLEFNEYYKITLEEYIVGGVVLAQQGSNQRELVMIFIDPDYKDQGIGTRALKMILGLHPEVRYYTSGAPEWSDRANRFLVNTGFNLVGVCADEKGQVINWYHMTLDDSFIYVPIGELKDGMKNLNVKGEILEKSMARTVRSRRRWKTLSVAEAGLGDESGRVVLTLWNEQIKYVRVGDSVIVENGYVTSYRGIKQLNVGRYGRIVKRV
jgi:N-acetylglutamate synthase-like GNAT family acetyltransferase